MTIEIKKLGKGIAPEDIFKALMSSCDILATSPSSDILGWDFMLVIQLAEQFQITLPNPNCFIQLKSTNTDKRSVNFKLSNLKKMSEIPSPTFDVLLVYNDDGVEELLFLPYTKKRIKEIYKRIDSFVEENGSFENANKKNVSVNFNEGFSIKDFSRLSILNYFEKNMLKDYEKNHLDKIRFLTIEKRRQEYKFRLNKYLDTNSLVLQGGVRGEPSRPVEIKLKGRDLIQRFINSILGMESGFTLEGADIECSDPDLDLKFIEGIKPKVAQIDFEHRKPSETEFRYLGSGEYYSTTSISGLLPPKMKIERLVLDHLEIISEQGHSGLNTFFKPPRYEQVFKTNLFLAQLQYFEEIHEEGVHYLRPFKEGIDQKYALEFDTSSYGKEEKDFIRPNIKYLLEIHKHLTDSMGIKEPESSFKWLHEGSMAIIFYASLLKNIEIQGALQFTSTEKIDLEDESREAILPQLVKIGDKSFGLICFNLGDDYKTYEIEGKTKIFTELKKYLNGEVIGKFEAESLEDLESQLDIALDKKYRDRYFILSPGKDGLAETIEVTTFDS